MTCTEGHCEAKYAPVAGSQCYQPTEEPSVDLDLGCPVTSTDGSVTMMLDAMFNKQTGECECVRGTVRYGNRCLNILNDGDVFGPDPLKGKTSTSLLVGNSGVCCFNIG